MLKIENVSIAYGEEPLFTSFAMHLHKGEIACISGNSGKGKSSLLNAIIGFVPICKGSIHVNDILLSTETIDKIRKYTAWVPQELALPTEWVKDMVQLPFTLKANKTSVFSKELLLEYFDELGLNANLYDKRVNEISGGQRQRIMLAVAALLNKPLMVVDEPTSALDCHSVNLVINFFDYLTKKKDMAILAVSHDRKFAEHCHQNIQL